MTQALRHTVRVQVGGVIEIRAPELIPGTLAEVIVLVDPSAGDQATAGMRVMTAGDLLESGLVGMWGDRTDIGDSVQFARRLREQAERRGKDVVDPA